MHELESNNDVVHTIRDRIMKLEEDHSDDESKSYSGSSYHKNY